MSPDPARLEALLAETAWVRALARRLCSDSASADDLVQDTWLAALRHRPDDRASPRAWLGKVLLNLHLARRRTEANRGARERGAARAERLPSSPDVVERVQSSRALVEHVLELEEPYRSAVLARFFDGLSAEEIAQREGLPSSTIRTRIQRGIEKLRLRLQREQGPDWLAAVAPLAGAGSPTGSIGAGIAGGLVMAGGTKLVLGLCAAALCTWFLWPRTQLELPSPEPRPDDASANVALAATEEPASPSQRSSNPAPPPQTLQSTVDELGTIGGTVVRRTDQGEYPVGGVRVELLSVGGEPSEAGQPDATPRSATKSNSTGTFRFEQLELGHYIVRARMGLGPWHECSVQLLRGKSAPQVLLAFGAARIHGRVHDMAGAPLADCVLSFTSTQGFTGADDMPMVQTARSDASGDYALEELPSGRSTLNLSPPGKDRTAGWPGRSCSIDLAEGDDLRLDAGSPQGVAHWRGVVRLRNGCAPRSEGWLKLFTHGEHRSPGGSGVVVHISAHFHRSGAFDVPLDPGDWSMSVGYDSAGNRPFGVWSRPVPLAGIEEDIVLTGMRLSGKVFDADTLAPLQVNGGELEVIARPAIEGTHNSPHAAPVQWDGSYVIDMIGSGDWIIGTSQFLLDAPGGTVTLQLPPDDEAEHTLDIRVRRP